ncbi:unnamed protein product [Orchesella dallaii]|uniref:Transmembrane protein n=1 Tax=Orchesella dallaii TaxID=48710 RepID=A0ABP1RGH8_9HEXA
MTFDQNPWFRMSLRRGALVVAAMTIIISLARVAFISTAINWNVNVTPVENGNLRVNVTPVMRKMGGLMSTEANINVLTVYIIMAIQLILNVLNIIFGAMLVHGVRKERPWFIRAYLIFSVVFLTLSLATLLLSLCLGIKMSIEVVVYEVILHFLYLYFIIVVYFVYVDLRDGLLAALNGEKKDEED